MKNINLLTKEGEILSTRESAAIFGGERCGCACQYRNAGGSSIADNSSANAANDLVSVGYRLQDCAVVTIDGVTWD